MSNDDLEHFIQDWHWDEKSHQFARDIGLYLLEFVEDLSQQALREQTVRKHWSNCWCIGILECQYGQWDGFEATAVFGTANPRFEWLFKKKMSDSKYAVSSYRTTWRKLHRYTAKRNVEESSSA